MRHTLRHLIILALMVLPACGSDADTTEEQATSSITLVVTPNAATMKVGETATFVVKMARTGSLDPVPEARWDSSRPEVVTVDAITGVAKAVSVGRAMLSAHYGPGVASASIEVVP